MFFPKVTGSNLLRDRISLPEDFEGRLILVLIAFQQWQQESVDTWIPAAQQLEAQFPGLRYCELPTIERMNRLSRFFINEGMRAGIPNDDTRRRTITLYLDKSMFKRALEIESEEAIVILLVDARGQVLWRAEGPYTPEKAKELRIAIEAASTKLLREERY
jgi:hypothetical protein